VLLIGLAVRPRPGRTYRQAARRHDGTRLARRSACARGRGCRRTRRPG
jgi:hypothetical protein